MTGDQPQPRDILPMDWCGTDRVNAAVAFWEVHGRPASDAEMDALMEEARRRHADPEQLVRKGWKA